MSDVLDYLRWRGDLPFTRDPVNPVDALIFSLKTSTTDVTHRIVKIIHITLSPLNKFLSRSIVVIILIL